jgi:hypothetical protein
MLDVQRFAELFPELQPVAFVLQRLRSDLCVLQDVPKTSYDTDARLTVAAETFAWEELCNSLETESAQIASSATDKPVRSIAVILDTLAASFAKTSETSLALNGKHLCAGLQKIRTMSDGVPLCEDELLHQWMQEYVFDPLNEVIEHGQKVADFVGRASVFEQDAVQRIRHLSDQISTPGFRADRPQLMTERDNFAHDLLLALAVKKDTAVSKNQNLSELLAGKLAAFEKARVANADELEKKFTHSNGILEKVSSACLEVQRFVDERSPEDVNMQKRSEQRITEMQKISDELQNICSRFLATLKECLSDAEYLFRQKVEREAVQSAAMRFLEKFKHIQELQQAHRVSVEVCLQLESDLGEWVNDLYTSMQAQMAADLQSLRSGALRDKARAEVLGQVALEQVCKHRDIFQKGLERRMQEIASCQETNRNKAWLIR